MKWHNQNATIQILIPFGIDALEIYRMVDVSPWFEFIALVQACTASAECWSHKYTRQECSHENVPVNVRPPGPRLNIKTVLSTYGDFHVKDKTAVRTSYL